MEEFSVRGLYGGAIEALLPTRLNSLGDLLPIPDTQEVFSDPLNSSNYIIELLEMSQLGTDTDAVNSIFSDIIESNQATESTIISIIPLSNNTFQITGKMCVSGKWVNIYLQVQRLAQFQTDLSFHISDPENLPSGPILEILSTFSSSLIIKDSSLFV